jgi:hypothetical protein
LHAPGGPALPALPFGALAVRLVGPGGKPGAGTLSGGTPGVGGAMLLTVAAGRATVTYAPPAEPARDTLVVALDDGAGGMGTELARLPVEVATS